MKSYSKKLINLICIFILFFTGCTTLQTDVYVYSENDSSIYDSIAHYEEEFINADRDYILKKDNSTGGNYAVVGEIEAYLNKEKIVEPALKARLYAFEGLILLISGKTKNAQSIYEKACQLQKGDSYILILGERLKNNLPIQKNTIETLCTNDTKNGILLLEKAKLDYLSKDYSKAIADFDSAFSFMKDINSKYETGYKEIRKSAWTMYSISRENQNNEVSDYSEITKNLVFEEMLLLTKDRTVFLNDFSGFTSIKTDKQIMNFYKRLDAEGFFTSPTDKNNKYSVDTKTIREKEITKREAVRFLWNIWCFYSDTKSDKYSEFYLQKKDIKTPVMDIPVTDPDFNAVLGLLELEVINLRDGKNFNSETILTKADYLQMLENMNSL